MKIKTKIALGIGTLFTVMLAILILNTYYIRLLAEDASAVIKDNQLSLDHVQSMHQALAFIHTAFDDSTKGISTHTDTFERNLYAAYSNATEEGEQEALQQLKYNYTEYKKYRSIASKPININEDSLNFYFLKTNQQLNLIYNLNRKAILEKNQKANNTASFGIKTTTIIGTLFTLIAFSFIINFPGYIANPINELSEKINAIAGRNFNQQLDFSSRDEFGTLARSFNHMARQLQEFQKSSVAELMIEKKRIESIVNNLDEGICLLDAGENIIAANPAMGRIVDIHELFMIGKPISKFSEINSLFRDIQDNLKTSAAKQPHITVNIDQEEYYYQLHVQQVFTYNEWDKINQLSGYVVVLKNVTEFRKRDIAKTNFLANVSHELKTPLSSINLSLKLLHDQRIGTLSAEQQHLVSNIDHESQRLLKFVNELLDYARNDAGNIKLRLEKISPAQIIQYSIDAIKPTLEQAEVQVKIKADDNLPPVLADVEKTVWVLTNLLSNAVRYGPAKASINISSEARQSEVVFTVADQGKGIDEQYHNQIFQRFTRINNKENNSPGTGLGLAIAKDFIDAQNGRIWVESQVGHGSKFSFTLKTI